MCAWYLFGRHHTYRYQDVIPYVLSDWISFLGTSILSPSIYIILLYFISHLRTDELASRLFTSIASVSPAYPATCSLLTAIS